MSFRKIFSKSNEERKPLTFEQKILRSSVIGMISVALVGILGTFGITYYVMDKKVKQAYNEGASMGMRETFQAVFHKPIK